MPGKSDAVWPSVALKKLVGDRVDVTDVDLKKGFEANFGPRVRCRAIVLNSQRKAQEVWEKARDNSTVENFGALAEAYSIEAGSRALKGEVPPIQKHGGQPLLEKEAFALEEGELSGIIQTAGDNFVILLCEGRTKPVQVDFEEVREQLHEELYEKKLRRIAREAIKPAKSLRGVRLLGVLAANAGFTSLASVNSGGVPGTVSVLSTGNSFFVSADAPSAFTTAPSGGDANVDFSVRYLGSGATTIADTAGTTPTRVNAGVTLLTVNLTAEKSSGTFPAGAYLTEAVVRCE